MKWIVLVWYLCIWDAIADTSAINVIYRQNTNISYTKSKKLNVSCLVCQLFLPQSIEARCYVQNDAAPTTSEWSTVLLPTMVRHILEVWQYPQKTQFSWCQLCHNWRHWRLSWRQSWHYRKPRVVMMLTLSSLIKNSNHYVELDTLEWSSFSTRKVTDVTGGNVSWNNLSNSRWGVALLYYNNYIIIIIILPVVWLLTHNGSGKLAINSLIVGKIDLLKQSMVGFRHLLSVVKLGWGLSETMSWKRNNVIFK